MLGCLGSWLAVGATSFFDHVLSVLRLPRSRSLELGVWSLQSRHRRRRLLAKLNDLKPTAKNIVPSAAYCT